MYGVHVGMLAKVRVFRIYGCEDMNLKIEIGIVQFDHILMYSIDSKNSK